MNTSLQYEQQQRGTPMQTTADLNPDTLRSLFHFRQEHGGPYATCGRISCEDLARSIAFYYETQSALEEPERAEEIEDADADPD
jgi:hypothetical protein